MNVPCDVTDNILEVAHLKVGYSGRTVVRDISLEVHPGEIVGLVGESGSGKSTVAKAIIRLLGPYGHIDGGSIRFEGRELTTMSELEMRALRGAGIGFIFQNPGASLCPIRRIGTQLHEEMAQHGKIGEEEARAKILDLFGRMELGDGGRILDSYPFELSGGMNQRVAIASAIILEPSLVIADEPTSALDVTVQAQVVRELMLLRERFKTSMLVISHNIGLVSYMADKVGVMYRGHIVEFGTPDDVLGNPIHPYTRSLIAAVPHTDEHAPAVFRVSAGYGEEA